VRGQVASWLLNALPQLISSVPTLSGEGAASLLPLRGYCLVCLAFACLVIYAPRVLDYREVAERIGTPACRRLVFAEHILQQYPLRLYDGSGQAHRQLQNQRLSGNAAGDFA
jgi:hypothetical protein